MTWSIAHVWDHAVDGNQVSPLNIVGLAGAEDILIILEDTTRTTVADMSARLSVDNGASYFSASGSYVTIDENGNATARTEILLTTLSSSTTRSGQWLIPANITAGQKAEMISGQSRIQFRASTLPINAIQIFAASGATTFNGGKITVLVRRSDINLQSDLADDDGLAVELTAARLLAAAVADDDGLAAELFVGGLETNLEAELIDDDGMTASLLAGDPITHIQSVIVVV